MVLEPAASRRRPRRIVPVVGLCVIACLALWSCRQREEPPAVDVPVESSSRAPRTSSSPVALAQSPASTPALPADRRHPRAGLEVTFLVAADTHFGFGRPADVDPAVDRSRPVGVERVHDLMARQMKAMAGRPWPAGLGGRVAPPRGLVVAGDLTEDGALTQWNRFLAWYGERGDDRNLGIPLFEMTGNHDRILGDWVANEVRRRHGGEFYSWDWDDLHIAVLGEAPDERSLAWLEQDLLRTGRWIPVVVMLHYPLAGPYSVDEWRGEGGLYDRFRNILRGYRIVGIFHGHYHAAGSYVWKGLDVYHVGSAKYAHRSFAVVRVTSQRMTVALWNTDAGTWWWWHDKSTDREQGRGVLRVVPLRGIDPPLIAR